jgi:hypothetical protein
MDDVTDSFVKQTVSSRNDDVLMQIFSYIDISKYVISQLYQQTKGEIFVIMPQLVQK